MASVGEQERDAAGSDEGDEAKSRVTPVMPPPNWLRELDDAPTLTPPKVVAEDDVFWSTPPRYSLFVSLAPGPLALPSVRRTWSARLLFATIACAVVALLALEMTSLGSRDPSVLARAPSALLAKSP